METTRKPAERNHLLGDSRHEVDLLLQVLPDAVRAALAALPTQDLVEIVLDLGRPVEVRLGEVAHRVPKLPVTRGDLRLVLDRIGALGDDNRAGIERMLHCISAIRNRKGEVIGLTLRVGRAVFGTIDMVRDLIETGHNLLLLGRPGVGKTTKLREMARASPTTSAGGWSWSTRRTRSAATETSRTRASALRGACRSPIRTASTR